MDESVLMLNIEDVAGRVGVGPVLAWLLGWVQQSFYLEVFMDLCDTFPDQKGGAAS